MIEHDNFHTDALPRLAIGISDAEAIVGNTMGPKGTNVIIESKLYPYTQITNDGATIIKEMRVADPIAKIGLSFLQEAADRSNTNSGDGSTTTVVLLDAIVKGGIKSGEKSVVIKKSLDECLPIIEKSIKEQTKEINVEDIPRVAEIAGENKELSVVLGDIYKKIGKDGIVHVEGSDTFETTYSLIEGVRFVDTGYLSPYMAHDPDTEKAGRKSTKAIYEKPSILVTKNKINYVKDIEPIIGALIARGDKSLVIFTDDMESSVARMLIELQNTPTRSLNILIIKAPTLWKSYVFEDFAKITGATIIEDASGTSLGTKFNLSWLGTCDKIVVDKEETVVIGTANIDEHIKNLTEENTNDSKLRLSWLTTKTAILKLGAKSETELSYLRLKAEDAVFSSRLALKNGVVAGGGSTLVQASMAMPDTIGGNILREALKAPARRIAKNALLDVEIGEDYLNGRGLDASTGEFVDMYEAGIIDAASITLGAVKNAIGIASTLLTAESVILLPPPTQAELVNNAVMRPAYL